MLLCPLFVSLLLFSLLVLVLFRVVRLAVRASCLLLWLLPCLLLVPVRPGFLLLCLGSFLLLVCCSGLPVAGGVRLGSCPGLLFLLRLRSVRLPLSCAVVVCPGLLALVLVGLGFLSVLLRCCCAAWLRLRSLPGVVVVVALLVARLLILLGRLNNRLLFFKEVFIMKILNAHTAERWETITVAINGFMLELPVYPLKPRGAGWDKLPTAAFWGDPDNLDKLWFIVRVGLNGENGTTFVPFSFIDPRTAHGQAELTALQQADILHERQTDAERECARLRKELQRRMKKERIK